MGQAGREYMWQEHKAGKIDHYAINQIYDNELGGLTECYSIDS